MRDDPLGLKPAMSLLGLLLVLAVIALLLFRQEVAESFRAGVNPNLRNARVWLAAGEVDRVAAFTLEPEHNDAKFVSVSDITIGPNTPKGMPLTFKLTNHGDSNDYPAIRVQVRQASGRPPRELTFKPADYPHTGRFDTTIVKLIIPVFAGETGFVVKAVYEDQK